MRWGVSVDWYACVQGNICSTVGCPVVPRDLGITVARSWVMLSLWVVLKPWQNPLDRLATPVICAAIFCHSLHMQQSTDELVAMQATACDILTGHQAPGISPCRPSWWPVSLRSAPIYASQRCSPWSSQFKTGRQAHVRPVGGPRVRGRSWRGLSAC